MDTINQSDDDYSSTARVADLERQVFTFNKEKCIVNIVVTSLREKCRHVHFVIVAKD